MVIVALGLPRYRLCIWTKVVDYPCLGLRWLFNGIKGKELSLGRLYIGGYPGMNLAA